MISYYSFFLFVCLLCGFPRCHVWHNSLGAAAVYLAWTGLVLFMRKFPKLGIYVVMFTDILQTFAQFFLVFFLFVIAFGLGFHILIHDQVSIFSFVHHLYHHHHCRRRPRRYHHSTFKSWSS